jgi:hypothetical protein
MIIPLAAKTIQQQLGKPEGWSTENNLQHPLIYTVHAALAG